MQESGEMYLESILVLSQKDAPVRSLDVARYLDVSKPSVSRAMAGSNRQRCLKTESSIYSII